jgi:hypothetical protein
VKKKNSIERPSHSASKSPPYSRSSAIAKYLLPIGLLVLATVACVIIVFSSGRNPGNPQGIGVVTDSKVNGRKTDAIMMGELVMPIPASWTVESRSDETRAVLVRVPGRDESDDALLTAYSQYDGFQGPESVLDHWYVEFSHASGKPTKSMVAEEDVVNVSGIKVILKDLTGNYQPISDAEGPPPVAKPGWRMFVAVVENTPTPSYVRVIGPHRTLAENRRSLKECLSEIYRR